MYVLFFDLSIGAIHGDVSLLAAEESGLASILFGFQ
jgi:hypothetical protein